MMRKIAFFVACITSLLMSSCEFTSDDLFLDETDKKYKLYDYYEDEYGNKGVVAAVASWGGSGELAYVLVLALDESYETWGPLGLSVYKDTVDSDILKYESFGQAMLQDMYYIGIEHFPAQAWCYRKNGSAYPYAGSWRLPSLNELKIIFGDKGSRLNSLNKALNKYGGTPVDKNNYYWTCLEDFDGIIKLNGQQNDYDQENRAFMTTPEGYTYSNKDLWLKKNHNSVRAVKYIYFND